MTMSNWRVIMDQYNNSMLEAFRTAARDGCASEAALRALVLGAKALHSAGNMSSGEVQNFCQLNAASVLREVQRHQQLPAAGQTDPVQPASGASADQTPGREDPGRADPGRAAPGRAAPGSNADKAAADQLGADFDPRNFVITGSNVTFDQVSGRDEMVEQLKQVIEMPRMRRMFPLAESKFGGGMDVHFLFYGPAGTGKGHLCRAIQNYMHQLYGDRSLFLSIDAHTLLNKFLGATDARLKALFDLAESDDYDYSVIFIDEIVDLCRSGEGNSTKDFTLTFQTLIEGIHGGLKHTTVIGCTNSPWLLNGAMRNRLSNACFIDLPKRADLIRFVESKPEMYHLLGDNEADRRALLEMIGRVGEQRHFSFRPMNNLYKLMHMEALRDASVRYPEGCAGLDQYQPLSRRKVEEIIHQLDAGFDAEQYKQLVEFHRASGAK